MPEDAQPRRKRQTTLSAEEIVTAALALVEDEGLDGFSFRKLAKRLHCEAMSIYYYFASKQHLFDAMVSRVISLVEPPDPGVPQREWLRTFTLSYRQAVLRHPGFALIVTTHRLNHREGLILLNRMARDFAPGAPMELKATVFRVISYYVTGAAMDEALGYAKGPSAANPVPYDEAVRDFPEIMEMGKYFSPDRHETVFLAGLDALLDWAMAVFTPPPPEGRG